MPGPGGEGRLQRVHGAEEIRLDRAVGAQAHRVDPRDGRAVDHDVRAFDPPVELLPVHDVPADHRHLGPGREVGESERIAREVVVENDLVFGDEPLGQMCADEARTAGDEDPAATQSLRKGGGA